MLGKVTATPVASIRACRVLKCVRYAYRRFGNSGGRALVLLQHFRGNLDNWDPALLDALAGERGGDRVYRFGVASNRHQAALNSVTQWRATPLFLVQALSSLIKARVARRLRRPGDRPPRRALCASSFSPAPGRGRWARYATGWRKDIAENARVDEAGAEQLLYIMFRHTPSSRKPKGVEYLGRFVRQKHAPSNVATRNAQTGPSSNRVCPTITTAAPCGHSAADLRRERR